MDAIKPLIVDQPLTPGNYPANPNISSPGGRLPPPTEPSLDDLLRQTAPSEPSPPDPGAAEPSLDDLLRQTAPDESPLPSPDSTEPDLDDLLRQTAPDELPFPPPPAPTPTRAPVPLPAPAGSRLPVPGTAGGGTRRRRGGQIPTMNSLSAEAPLPDPTAEVHRGLRGWLEKKLGPAVLGSGLGVAYAGGLLVFADKLNGLALPMAAVPAVVWGISKAVVAVQERRIRGAAEKLQGNSLTDDERVKVEAKLERWRQPGILTKAAARVSSSTAVTSFAAVSLVAGVPAVRFAPQIKEFFGNIWVAAANELNRMGFGTGGDEGRGQTHPVRGEDGIPPSGSGDGGGANIYLPVISRGESGAGGGDGGGANIYLPIIIGRDESGAGGGEPLGSIPGTELSPTESHNLLTSIPRTVTVDTTASGNSVWAACVEFTQPISDALHLTPQQGLYLADAMKDVMAKYYPHLQPGDVIDFTPHLDEIINYAGKAIPANIANPGRSPALESLTEGQLQDLINRVLPVLQSLKSGS